MIARVRQQCGAHQCGVRSVTPLHQVVIGVDHLRRRPAVEDRRAEGTTPSALPVNARLGLEGKPLVSFHDETYGLDLTGERAGDGDRPILNVNPGAKTLQYGGALGPLDISLQDPRPEGPVRSAFEATCQYVGQQYQWVQNRSSLRDQVRQTKTEAPHEDAIDLTGRGSPNSIGSGAGEVESDPFMRLDHVPVVHKTPRPQHRDATLVGRKTIRRNRSHGGLTNEGPRPDMESTTTSLALRDQSAKPARCGLSFVEGDLLALPVSSRGGPRRMGRGAGSPVFYPVPSRLPRPPRRRMLRALLAAALALGVVALLWFCLLATRGPCTHTTSSFLPDPPCTTGDGGSECFRIGLELERKVRSRGVNELWAHSIRDACNMGHWDLCWLGDSQRDAWDYHENIFCYAERAWHSDKLCDLVWGLELGLRGPSAHDYDAALALSSFSVACQEGIARACVHRGLAIALGRGRLVHLGTAVVAFDRACELGDELGCVLAVVLLSEQGLSTAYGEPAPRLAASCKRGEALGCYALAFMREERATYADLLNDACVKGHNPLLCRIVQHPWWQATP